jgi:protein transport protein SEC61 subunit gamma-like protein
MEDQERRGPFVAMKEFGRKCVRVFRVARKPTNTEFKQVSKVSALGLAVIGLIGFVIGIVIVLIFV